jgi:DNA mismatch repair protein MutS
MGRDILEIRDAIRRLKALDVPLSPALEDLDDDPRRAFVLIREQPERLRAALRSLARLEILWRMSQETRLQPVVFRDGPLTLSDVIDISLPDGVPSSIELSGATTHAVITGPNGGGKSSFMRAVLQTVLFGHSYGYAPGGAQMPRFKWIASGLQLRDSPGRLSMFETEVKFAATALAAGAGPGLVLFDELFHSTNAPDGTRTATLFLEQLWSRKNVYSVVSTHIFPLIEAAPKGVKAICCQATDGPDGVQYSYKVEPGICRVSSVKMVWERFGLLLPAK